MKFFQYAHVSADEFTFPVFPEQDQIAENILFILQDHGQRVLHAVRKESDPRQYFCDLAQSGKDPVKPSQKNRNTGSAEKNYCLTPVR